MRKHGFTLIELLVVIAIIAILAAILFPVFATAREKARQTSCLANIKQIALATLMYTDDWDETFPSALNFGEALENCTITQKLVHAGYVPWQMWQCPSHGSITGFVTSYYGLDDPWMYDGYFVGYYSSYGFNFWYLGAYDGLGGAWMPSMGDSAGHSYVTQAAIKSPASMVMWCDTAFMFDPNGETYGLSPDAHSDCGCLVAFPAGYGSSVGFVTSDTVINGVGFRHNGFANFAFVDGHAKALKAGYPATQMQDGTVLSAANWGMGYSQPTDKTWWDQN